MSVREYIGARYVPIFANPIDWDSTKTYEPLTIVYHQGNSYTSRQYVPTGIEISNTSYWCLTGNYNAQVEQYRQEVAAFDGRITANATAIANEVTARMAADTELQTAITAETTARENADTALDARITTNTNAIAAETTARENADTVNANAIAAEATARAEADANIIARINREKYLFVIGDSYSSSAQTGTPLWYNIYANAKNLQPYTTSSDGQGFINGNNNFQTQLTNGAAYLADKYVQEVIVMGGLNDFNNTSETPADIGAAAKQLADDIREAFPTAEITFAVFPPFQYFGYYSNTYSNRERAMVITNNIIYNLTSTDVKIVNLSTFGLFIPDYFGAENSGGQAHPSAKGSYALANKLLGGDNFYTSQLAGNCPILTKLETGTNVNCTFPYTAPVVNAISENCISLNFTINITDGSQNASVGMVNIPPCNQFCVVTDSAGKCIMGYFGQDGVFHIPAFNAAGTCYFCVIVSN